MATTNSRPSKLNLILHPILFAIFPVLALLAFNAHEIEPGDGLRALVLTGLLGIAVWGLTRFFFQDRQQAALAATGLLVLFFSYGHIYDLIPTLSGVGAQLGRHRFLGPVWLLLLLALLAWLRRGPRDLGRGNRGLNLAAVLLVASSLFQIVWAESQDLVGRQRQETLPPSLAALQPPETGAAPDIYYIVLDGYSRADLLLEQYDLDITSYLQRMGELGFYYAECGQSNYAQTKLSLSSALNMDYIENFFPGEDPDAKSSFGLEPYLINSRVRQSLELLGYTTIAFETGFTWSELEKAEVYLSPQSQDNDGTFRIPGPNKFELVVLDSTLMRLIGDAGIGMARLFGTPLAEPDLVHRERVLFVLDQLVNLPDGDRPRFVFAHIVSPHDPYVFAADGAYPSQEASQKELYAQQTLYLNARITEIAAEILSQSERPPIIIIQSDHGTGVSYPADRMHNLGLYYLPDGGQTWLYPRITPVNSFRIILNHYFGAELPLLDDQSFFSTYGAPFDYQAIQNTAADCSSSGE
jgi:hypothetical protein